MITEKPIFENIFYVFEFNLHAENMHVVTLIFFCDKPLNNCIQISEQPSLSPFV